MVTSNRYDGKPMLRLLECYVLWAIGKLESKEEYTLAQMEPKLRQVLNQEGDWREIIARAMSLPSNMPELIRANWAENLEIAKQHSATLTPQQFAEMFVDDNLAR
ncbi:hypothetical protein OPIT5_01590 [Opitutaceae bacterium TAV5]|nr:hypothetical protein OPIT5_01590 [Opitutaceae bacterium TAV5]